MRTLPSRLPVALLLLFLAGRAGADEVVLTHGSRLPGVVLARDENAVRVLQPSGDEVVLAPADVKEVSRDADAPVGDQVIRYAEGPRGQGLQVALIHLLHPTTGRRVDLVGAVHIADAAYYRQVQRLLEADDVVLYEMVKPKDVSPSTKPTAGEKGALGVRDIQKQMGEWLGLTFQMDQIAYDRPHFVHADLTLEQFREAQGGQDLEAQMKGMLPLLGMLEGLMSAGGGKSLKPMLGRMLAGAGNQLGALLGSDTTELLLDRRNEVVLRCLGECAPSIRSVAIFFGAAHLPDLEKRLVAQGYRRAASRWITAWDTSPPKPDAPLTPPAKPKDAPEEAPVGK